MHAKNIFFFFFFFMSWRQERCSHGLKKGGPLGQWPTKLSAGPQIYHLAGLADFEMTAIPWWKLVAGFHHHRHHHSVILLWNSPAPHKSLMNRVFSETELPYKDDYVCRYWQKKADFIQVFKNLEGPQNLEIRVFQIWALEKLWGP